MQVEFFGIPRERAGMSEVEVQAGTLGQLLTTLRTRIPSLAAFIGEKGPDVRLNPVFVASLNGDRFITDPETPLGENDHVLILSADAGG
jgi:molybdopterin converting factor small subunit